ncbi:DUF6345 domain-containing protein [Amycolatopsis sp. cmx-4-68]|uniref:DUF6345 domain-containing protein n=1 Tax=Amycolatopsis sp. cmx-4-68 TaxID=2790938 RepID=UPI003978CC6E
MALLLTTDTPPAPDVRIAPDTGGPFAAAEPATREARAAAGMYGMCSIEDFPGTITDLQYTHEDVQGFYDFVTQFTVPNYWLKDSAVQAWVYDQAYDNWQDQYGFDSACVVYHSGHGDMDAGGVYSAPMGGSWDNRDWIHSSEMRLGDNHARYIFFSTCLSLRVHDGMTPITTWHPANGGFRMLFGYETTSVDSTDYGANFWEEWGKNKTFCASWLDASWRIDRQQTPSVMACGTTPADATARLDTERQFERAAAPTTGYAWRWRDAEARGRSRAANRTLPTRPATVLLTAPTAGAGRAAELAARFGISGRPAPARATPGGPVLVGAGAARLVVARDGSYEVRLAESGQPVSAPDPATARSTAEQAVRNFGLADEVDLVYDAVHFEHTASASTAGDGTVNEPRVSHAMVSFRQVVNGLPVTGDGRGEVRVQVDGTDTVTSITDTSRPITDLVDRPGGTVAPPDGTAPRSEPVVSQEQVEPLLDRAVQRTLQRLAAGGRVPTFARTVPGSTEVGYQFGPRSATVVARRTVEVDCGAGLAKRYIVRVPIIE